MAARNDRNVSRMKQIKTNWSWWLPCHAGGGLIDLRDRVGRCTMVPKEGVGDKLLI